MSEAEPVKTAAKPPRPGFFGLDLLDNRYPALHGLRVLAILSVIQIHVTWDFHDYVNLHYPQWWVDRSYAVFFGMDCFFVLSGFLIGSILIRSIDTTGTQQIRRFYLRRIFRTFPSYYVVLTILVFAFHLNAAQRAHLPYEYTYLTNFAPLGRNQVVMLWGWSLSLEEQFYLFVPLLFVILRKLPTDRARVIFLALLALSGLASRLFVYWRGYPWEPIPFYESIYFRTPTRFDSIVAGVLLAVVEARWGDRVAEFVKHPARRAMLVLPALACLWVLLYPEMFGEDHTHTQITHLFCWGTLTSVMYLCTVPILLHGDGPITRALSLPIWRRMATLGYGVYLVHIPLLDHVVVPVALRAARHGVHLALVWLGTFAATIVLSFAVGYVMHVLIEKPSLRIREWLAA